MMYVGVVAELPFSLDLIRQLAENRGDWLTRVFLFFTYLGDVEGYVLLISVIYVTYDKGLAFRLSVLTLVTMSINHLLKTVIMNPRPFISEGTYAQKWAVSPARAAELATEYSTPSGHAMGGASFYAYLYASVKRRSVRIACVALLLLTGLSRPYLGVHYLEDVLGGWVLGIAIVLFSIRYADRIGSLWSRLSYRGQIGSVVAASVLLWLATRALSGWDTAGLPLAFLGYAGFLTGIVIAFPLEAQKVGFDPRSASAPRKILRCALSVGLILGTLILLDGAFAAISADTSVWGHLLRYLRYAAAGIAGVFLGPLLFVKLGLAGRLSERAAA
jgi:membrane-associated phospholipid phosphatase